MRAPRTAFFAPPTPPVRATPPTATAVMAGKRVSLPMRGCALPSRVDRKRAHSAVEGAGEGEDQDLDPFDAHPGLLGEELVAADGIEVAAETGSILHHLHAEGQGQGHQGDIGEARPRAR